MANVTGEYPEDRLIPALTVPFTKTQKGAAVVAANLQDPNHPINISNISGKTRGASVLLDDGTIWVALGNRSIDPWAQLGGSGGGAGTVVSVDGVAADENGDVDLNAYTPANPPPATPGALKYRAVTGQTYTVLETDVNTMLIFDFDGIVSVTLPDAITAVADPTKVFMALNKGGAMTFIGTGLQGGSDVPRGRVAGVARIPAGWVVTGAI
ncbi:hypothetical protein [Pseudomonas phage Njord]|uniref:Uncharacterized protein n=1 Tax=Pseudomonas phage Njord TaxID=2163985 RepID=A0A2S1GMN2_9CAUD|nr:acetyl-CoA acetyltransferase [Pseudomonas phage Njord]AWD90629.1 hypothetical protein [Pseudomonas phage Njord]